MRSRVDSSQVKRPVSVTEKHFQVLGSLPHNEEGFFKKTYNVLEYLTINIGREEGWGGGLILGNTL